MHLRFTCGFGNVHRLGSCASGICVCGRFAARFRIRSYIALLLCVRCLGVRFLREGFARLLGFGTSGCACLWCVRRCRYRGHRSLLQDGYYSTGQRLNHRLWVTPVNVGCCACYTLPVLLVAGMHCCGRCLLAFLLWFRSQCYTGRSDFRQCTRHIASSSGQHRDLAAGELVPQSFVGL